MKPPTIRVLLIDDSEDDVLLTRHMLAQGKSVAFAVDWAPSYAEGLRRLTGETHDVALIDYRLDKGDGLALMVEARRAGCRLPMVILTGLGDEQVDTVAMQAGAADYLVKGKHDADMLQRVIRHALERHRAQNALDAERRRLQTLIDALPDFIYFKDAAGRFIINNAAHLALLGQSSQSMVTGRTDTDFFPASLASQYMADEQRILATGEALISKEETVFDRDGQRQWLLTTKVPLKTPDGETAGIVGLSRNITALKQAEEKLRLAHDELEQRVIERTAELSQAVSAQRREMDQREQAEGQLREAEERYRQIFEQMLDAIVLIDAETTRMIEFNEPAYRRLGYTRDEFARLSIADIDAEETPSTASQHLHRIIAQGADVFESRHRAKSGAIRHVIVSTRPITLRGRRVILSLWHDFTERKHMEDELREAIVRLEKHDRAKSEFVTNVSHELKTPLTSMMYGTRNLLKGIAGPLPEEAVRYLRMFDAECQRLVNTINDILDLGKLDSRTLSLSPVTMPLGRLVARGVDTFRDQAEAVGIALQREIGDRSGFVRCDPAMMQRVLQNILSNAVKFTPAGGSIRIRANPSEKADRLASIVVTDTGVGIPAEAIGHVTERYFRVGSHPTGSGLGLAISREIVTLHGGRLTLASPAPGQSLGTEVTITLPTAPAPTVLIADADPRVLGLLESQLTEWGYRVRKAAGGQDLLRLAEAGGIELIVLDLIMRDMRGSEVILALKSSASLRYVPVVVVTGATVDEAQLDVLTRFSVPTLPKPWRPEELQETVENALVGVTAFQGMKR